VGHSHCATVRSGSAPPTKIGMLYELTAPVRVAACAEQAGRSGRTLATTYVKPTTSACPDRLRRYPASALQRPVRRHHSAPSRGLAASVVPTAAVEGHRQVGGQTLGPGVCGQRPCRDDAGSCQRAHGRKRRKTSKVCVPDRRHSAASVNVHASTTALAHVLDVLIDNALLHGASTVRLTTRRSRRT
jgi:hypothetical protein